MQNSVDSSHFFPSRVENQISLAQREVSFETPLMSNKIEIPKLDEMNSFELYNAETYLHPTSHLKTDRLPNAESFHETPPEKSNEAIEREIDEFLKSILRMHSCRHIGSEIESSSEKVEDSSRSVYRSSESVYTKKRKSSSRSKYYEETSSDESVSCDESSVGYESRSSNESFGDRDYRKINCRVHKYQARRKKVFKRAKRRIESESIRPHPNNTYPLPPSGIKRKKTGDISVIQAVTENLKYPCVGLNKIIEIRGLEETHYYCKVCDLQCSYRYILAHLETYQHRLESLKPFVPLIYKNYSKYRRYEIENKVNKTTNILVEMFGCGKIQVEKDYPYDNDSHSFTKNEKHRDIENSHKKFRYSFFSKSTKIDLSANSKSQSYKSALGSADRRRISDYRSTKKVTVTKRLDASYNHGDKQSVKFQKMPLFYHDTHKMPHHIKKYYCQACRICMHNRQNWEMHLSGGKHITNAKRARGEIPFRRRAVLVPDARAALMDELDKIEEPVVGLDMMKETQDSDVPWPTYTCHLCSHNTTSMQIIPHILSVKHRIKFLEDIGHPYLHTLKERGTDMHSLQKIVRNICADVEAEQGRGNLSVYTRSAEFEYRSYASRSGTKTSREGRKTVQQYLRDSN